LACRIASASAELCPYCGSPVRDIADVSESSRSGCSIARRWTIIPPIDSPSTCARSAPTASSAAIASPAMSVSVYVVPESFDDKPVSRLSNRTTR
jgi:hypothetical protein